MKEEAVGAQVLPERAEDECQEALRPREGAVGGAAEAVVAACSCGVEGGKKGDELMFVCVCTCGGEKALLTSIDCRQRAPSKKAPKRRSTVRSRPAKNAGGRMGPAAPTCRMMSNALYGLCVCVCLYKGRMAVVVRVP